MAPFDTSRMVTFWIPLQPIPSPDGGGGTGLLFADGSHSDFALPYWNGQGDGPEHSRLDARYSRTSHHMPLAVGDCTVHAGWTLHCAAWGGRGAETESSPPSKERYAYAITYVDAGAEVREDAAGAGGGGGGGDDEDAWSYRDWLADVPPRTRLSHHPSIPVVWPPWQGGEATDGFLPEGGMHK